MDKEYIERGAVLQHKRKMSGADFGGEFWDEAVLCEEIWKIPAADVVEVKHGRWIQEYRSEKMYYSLGDIEQYKVPDGFSCSICSKWKAVKTNYCPICGAKMDGENNG